MESKNKYPDLKIERSKFVWTRPNWCVLAGGFETHCIYVRLYQQIIKLIIEGAKLKVDYKDLPDITVCDINNYKCMISDCDLCPGKEALSDMF